VGVAAQVRLDVRGAGRAVHLGGAPPLGVVPERRAPGPRVDVLPGDNRRGDVVEPPLSVRLAGEVARVLAAVRVAVPGPPLAVRRVTMATDGDARDAAATGAPPAGRDGADGIGQ
jgi:hypothetical protein